MNKMICKKCNSKEFEKIELYSYIDVYECKSCNYRYSERLQNCCRNKFDVISFWQNTNGIYNQCLNCGGCTHITKPLPHAKYSDKIRADFNEHRYYNWKSANQLEKDDFYQTNRAVAKMAFWSSYINHLNSDAWKTLRQLVLKRDKHLCQKCHEKPATDVHHLSYKNLGKEPLSDLESLCRTCHKKVHGR